MGTILLQSGFLMYLVELRELLLFMGGVGGTSPQNAELGLTLDS